MFINYQIMVIGFCKKHFVDRTFDRSGQLAVVVSPGVGIFMAHRERIDIAIQRVIDNRVGNN